MLKRVIFIGSKQLGLKALIKIGEIAPESLCTIITVNDESDGERSTLKQLKEYSKKIGKDLRVLNRPSELEIIIDQEKPDLVIVVGWYWIISPKVLSKASEGFVGIHGSLLPAYRGGAPLVWPIINGDNESGLSLFYLEEGMDKGDIIGQGKFPIEEKDTITTVLEKSEDVTLSLIEKYYPLLLEGKAPRQKQDHTKASYCSQRKMEDGKIDWNKSNRAVYNFVRAQTHPYPGAFCLDKDGRKITFWQAEVFPNNYYGPAGKVVELKQDGAIITCGEGAIIVKSISVDGQDASAQEYLKFGMNLY